MSRDISSGWLDSAANAESRAQDEKGNGGVSLHRLLKATVLQQRPLGPTGVSECRTRSYVLETSSLST